MILYHILSVVNAIAALSGLVVMGKIMAKYEIPRVWSLFFFYMFLQTFAILLTQVYTISNPPLKSNWKLKYSATLFCFMVFVFCRAITKVSMIQENYYKDTDIDDFFNSKIKIYNMKKVLKKIGDFFVKLFGGVKKAQDWLEDHVPEAIELINRIITIATSPTVSLTVDSILSLFGENIRNGGAEGKAKAIKLLADAARMMNIGNDCLNKPSDPEVILCFVEALKKRSPIDMQSTATKIGSLYLLQQQPELLKLSDTDTALQFTYKGIKIDQAIAA